MTYGGLNAVDADSGTCSTTSPCHQFRDALFEGYTGRRPLPGDLAYLDDFIATRNIAFAL